MGRGVNLTKKWGGASRRGRRQDRDAEGVEAEGVEGEGKWGGGNGEGISPGRKRVLVHFELEGTHLVTTNFVFVKCLRDILKTPKGMGRDVLQMHFPLQSFNWGLLKRQSVTT